MAKKSLIQQESFANLVDDALLYMALADLKPLSPKTIPLMDFSHAYLLLRSTVETLREEALVSGYSTKGVSPPRNGWPVATLSHEPGGLLLTRMRPMPSAEKSKLLMFGVVPKRYEPTRLFSISLARIDIKKGAYRADRFVLTHKGGDRFGLVETVGATMVTTGSKFGGREGIHTGVNLGEFREEAEIGPVLMYCLACTASRVWSVSFSQLGSPSVRFLTDPTGVKSLFSMRDKPEGRTRREALTHWVTDHWRKQRNDPDMEAYVRQHLRGSTDFQWFGLRCEVKPSEIDLEKNDQAAEQRRSNGKMLRVISDR